MKSIYFFLFLIGFFLMRCQPKINAAEAQKTATEAPKLRHVVLFKFKNEITEARKTEIQTAFGDFIKQVPELVQAYEFGINNSPEGLDQGLTHCFIVTFASEKDRNTYIPNAFHQAFVKKYLSDSVEKVTVVDFWVK
jgi:hypothetical protein